MEQETASDMVRIYPASKKIIEKELKKRRREIAAEIIHEALLEKFGR